VGALRALLLPLVCLQSLACSNLTPPSAEVRGLQLNQITEDGIRLDVTMDVTNPNAEALPLTHSKYQLSLAGKDLIKGEAKPDVTIPAGETKAVTLPLDVSFDRLTEIAPALLRAGGSGISYKANFDLRLGESGLFARGATKSIRHDGEVDLTKLAEDPTFLLKSSALRGIFGGLMRGKGNQAD
jgi:LEA14-like dessication related protein